MSDHLPECSHPSHVQANVDAQFCHYCVPLRACEARVRTAMHAAEREEYLNGLYEGRNEGYAAGVQAALDAVAALDHYRVLECDPGLMHGKRDDPDPWSQGYLVYSDDALAALRALLPEGSE